MDAPRIQYAKTEDGVSIAYTTFGTGPPLVVLPALTASHLQVELQMPGRRQAYERLASRSTVVMFDRRGQGMSDRETVDFSEDAGCIDIEAVRQSLGLAKLALFSRAQAGELGMAYTARNPDVVTHLIVFAGLLPPSNAPELPGLATLRQENWDLFTEVQARLVVGWDSPDGSYLAAMLRASHTPQSYRQAFEEMRSTTQDSYAAEIRVPTLVIYPTSDVYRSSRARTIASKVAGSSVFGAPNLDVVGFSDALALEAMLDFIASRPEETRVDSTADLDRGVLRTILFTDLEAHTAMMNRLGDARGREVLREHERISRDALRAHGGTEVKTIGDSFMASFPSAQKAIECAIALQRAFAAGDFAGERLRIRVGINAGEPIADEDDLFGSSVILASRTKEKAAGGEIFVTDVVRQLVAGKGFAFTDRGEMEMKGFDEPVRLYEVRWQEGAA
jgi:class 3 adenylate cyclase/pimeloyl-ACP methyl ester carboxylesterase